MKYLCLSIGILCCLLTGCGASPDSVSELPPVTETESGNSDTTTCMTEETTETDEKHTTAGTESAKTTALTDNAETTTAAQSAASAGTTAASANGQQQADTPQQMPVDHSAERAATEAEVRRLADETAAAQANANEAVQQCNAARDTYNAAVQQRDQYLNENRGSIEGITQGAFGFYTAMGAQSALDALNNAAYASYTRRGEETDATSLTNMKKSFAFMRECNELRAAEGLGALRVTDRLMAIAQSDLNWSDGNLDHSRQFNVGENLAWNYSDPFSGWYHDEKPTRGGHYMNIINSGYQLTGFAVCTAGRSGSFSVSHGQVFDFSTGEASYTVDEYEARFDDFCSGLGGVHQQWIALDQAVTDAEAQLNALTAQMNEANAVLAQKQRDLQAAESRLQRLQ